MLDDENTNAPTMMKHAECLCKPLPGEMFLCVTMATYQYVL